MNNDWLKSLEEIGVRTWGIELSTGYKITVGNYDKAKYCKMYIAPPNSNTYYKIGVITNLTLLKEAFKNDR